MFRAAALAAAVVLSAMPAQAAIPAEAPAAAGVDTLCRALVGRVRNLALQQCLDAGLNAAASSSVEGRSLVFREFRPPAAAATTPAAHFLQLISNNRGGWPGTVVGARWIQGGTGLPGYAMAMRQR